MTKTQRANAWKDAVEIIGAAVGGFLGQFLQPFQDGRTFDILVLHVGPVVMGAVLGWSFMQIFEKGGEVNGKRANYKKRLAYAIVAGALASAIAGRVIAMVIKIG